MSKKCFSVCRKQTKEDCKKTRRCRYNVGNEREFCRLNMSKYKLNKDCVTKTRITNKNRYDEAAKVIQRNARIVKNKKKQTRREDVRREVHKKLGSKYPLTKKEEEYYTDFFFFLKNI